MTFPFEITCLKPAMEISKKCVKSVQISQIKTPEKSQWRRSSVFIVYSEQISHIVIVF